MNNLIVNKYLLKKEIATFDNGTVLHLAEDMNTLLPIIVSQSDAGLRDEFIRDSGLDRLLVEELEVFWCIREKIPPERLVPIRRSGLCHIPF